MSFTIITAMDEAGGIGYKDDLPWPAYVRKEELPVFKRLTLGKFILMGRKTAEIVGPLSRRSCFVLSRDGDTDIDGFYTVTFSDLDALSHFGEIMVCGGAEVYKLLLPRSSAIIISSIKGTYSADTFFPLIDWNEWHNEEVLQVGKYFETRRYTRLAACTALMA